MHWWYNPRKVYKLGPYPVAVHLENLRVVYGTSFCFQLLAPRVPNVNSSILNTLFIDFISGCSNIGHKLMQNSMSPAGHDNCATHILVEDAHAQTHVIINLRLCHQGLRLTVTRGSVRLINNKKLRPKAVAKVSMRYVTVFPGANLIVKIECSTYLVRFKKPKILWYNCAET